MAKTINKSGNTNFKGVHLHKRTGKYEARFTYGKEIKYLGSFSSASAAASTRIRYILSLV